VRRWRSTSLERSCAESVCCGASSYRNCSPCFQTQPCQH
jgi:hypothetical protein